MRKSASGDGSATNTSASAKVPRFPFLPGALVIVSLHSPREKYWGMILALAPEGLGLSGADLGSFEDIAAMTREGEPFTPAVMFFPMHRIERIDLDVPDGSLSSLGQRFQARTGMEPEVALAAQHHHHHATREVTPRAQNLKDRS